MNAPHISYAEPPELQTDAERELWRQTACRRGVFEADQVVAAYRYRCKSEPVLTRYDIGHKP